MEKSWKNHGILLVSRSGNPEVVVKVPGLWARSGSKVVGQGQWGLQFESQCVRFSVHSVKVS